MVGNRHNRRLLRIALSSALAIAALAGAALWWSPRDAPAPAATSAPGRPAPAPTTSITIEALGMGDTPVSGVSVHWRAGNRAGIAAPTGPDGRTSLDLPPGVVEVRLEKLGLARTGARVVLQGKKSALRLQLHPEQRLRGRIVDDRGVGLEGATVRAVAPDAPWLGDWRATSEADGRFELAQLPADELDLEFAGPAHETRRLRRRGDSPEPELLVSLARRGVVEVTVRDGGQPAAQALVVLTGPLIWPAREQRSDEAGRCVFDALPGGRYQLRARRAERVAGPTEPRELVPGQRAARTLSLRPGATLHGRALDTAGQPLAGVEVLLRDTTPGLTPRATTSDAQGRFRFAGVWPGALQLEARAAGYAASVRALPGPPAEPVSLTLLREVSLAGRVQTVSGKPVAGALVWVATPSAAGALETAAEGPGELGVTVDPVPPIPTAPQPLHGATRHTAHSDAEGRFRITGLPPGDLVLGARSPGYAPDEQHLKDVPPGAARADLSVVLRQGGSVSGRVTDERGFPLSGLVAVLLRGDEELEQTRSDERGQFRFADVLGELRVEVRPHAHAPRGCDLKIDPGEVASCELSLSEAVFQLAVRVVDARGFPVDGARLRLRPRARPRGRSWVAVSAADGTAHLHELPAPPYLLDVERAGYLPVRGRLAEDTGGELELALEPAGAVRGVVVDALGAPVEGATVGAAPAKAEATSGPQGDFVLAELGAGDYALWAEHPEAGRRSDLPAHVRPGETLPGVRIVLPGRLTPSPAPPPPDAGAAPPPEDGGAAEPPQARPPRGLEVSQRGADSVVTHVPPRSPARAAGLRPGDVLERVDGEAVLSAAQARGMLRDPGGTMATVRIRRGKRTKTLRWRRPALK